MTNIVLLAVPEAVSSHDKVRRRSVVPSFLCVAPRCSQMQSSPIFQNEEQISCVVHSLYCFLLFPETFLSRTKVRSRSVVQSILCIAPCCSRSSVVPYKSKEHHFCGALLTERTLLAGWVCISEF